MGADGVISGAQVLLVTPFDEAGEVDAGSLRTLVDFVVDAGVDGIVALGTTGEFFAMTPAEREGVMGLVARAVRGRVPLTFGVGDPSTRTAVAQATAAVAAGADCVMVQPPWYYAHTGPSVELHLLAVAAAVPVPVMVYDGGGGIRVPPAALGRLRERAANVRYVKIGLPDVETVRTVAADVPGVDPLCGDDSMMLLALRHGAVGSTVGSGNVQPATLASIHRAVAAGDLPLARKLHARELLPAVNACCVPKAEYIRCYKEVLAAMGVIAAPTTRPPLVPLDGVRREELFSVMAEVGVL